MKLPRIRWSTLKCGLSRPATSGQLGLFGNPQIQSPSDFNRAFNSVVVDCEAMIKEIIVPFDQRRIKKKTVALLDDVSNRLCTIADLSSCVRNMHPDSNYLEAANQAMIKFTELVESLNTMPGLYNALKQSLKTEAHVLDTLDRRTLQLLIDDFEQCGVHLEETKRQEFVNLSNEIYRYDAEFCENAERMHSIGNYIRHDSKQENVLKNLVLSRHRLAQLTGFKTYAHRAQKHTILGTYEAAVDFLDDVSNKLRPFVETELDQIRKVLVDKKRIKSTDKLTDWDIEVGGYLKRQEIGESHGNLSKYLSFGNILHGFESLCLSLYGLRFEINTPSLDEIWPGCVLRLDVYRSENFLGTIYVDVDSRKNKVQGDCHFTVRCSKLLDDASYQRPIIVLSLSVANIRSRGIVNADHLLNSVHFLPQQAENFFHEMGHAMHSILGATRYQHVAGTRCPTDFAEVPSNLMEFFFSDPRVLAKFCKDESNVCNTDTASAIGALLNVFPAMNIIQQVHYSMFDLYLHGEQAEAITVNNQFSTTDLYLSLGNKLLPEVTRPRDFAYHHRLTHLSAYGAKYYSYVIAKACASQIWFRHFEKNPFDAEAGKLWAKIQSFGGERPSDELLNMTLDQKVTSEMLANALCKLHN
ncbi:Mitochondrial intermediate peptidase [Aphelenchoides bicaudatus]|nr:Mitochondrial intermediate peptidase [Aphelenchoides bicaudatus]